MLGSEQHDQVALLVADDQALLQELVNPIVDCKGFEETQKRLVQCQEVLLLVAGYTEPAETVQRVCAYPAQIIMLQKEITDLKARHFLPPTCYHLVMDETIPSIEKDLDEGQRRPADAGSSEELQADLAAITQNAQESREEVWTIQIQLANALTLAARAAPAAPQSLEDKGQKFPDSLNFSGLDRTWF